MTYVKDSERLLGDKVAIYNDFCKLQEDMKANIDSIQASLDAHVQRTKAIDSDRSKLLVSKKSYKRQMLLMSADSKEVDDLGYPS